MNNVKILYLTTNQILISQIEEVTSELGEPDCKLIEPFVICDDGTLSPWLLDYTNQNDFMISSDKLLTIADPNSKLKTKYEELFEVSVVLRDPKSETILIRQCAAGERWEGLWDFPRFECAVKNPTKPTTDEISKIKDEIKKLTNQHAIQPAWLTQLKHGVTKYRITLNCFEAHVSQRAQAKSLNLQWVHADDLDSIPLSVTGRKLAKAIS